MSRVRRPTAGSADPLIWSKCFQCGYILYAETGETVVPEHMRADMTSLGLNEEIRAWRVRVRELLEMGGTLSQIADHLGVTHETIKNEVGRLRAHDLLHPSIKVVA